jgi:hypothetical protein
MHGGPTVVEQIFRTVPVVPEFNISVPTPEPLALNDCAVTIVAIMPPVVFEPGTGNEFVSKLDIVSRTVAPVVPAEAHGTFANNPVG